MVYIEGEAVAKPGANLPNFLDASSQEFNANMRSLTLFFENCLTFWRPLAD
jgi:hypothetical protein